MIPSNNVSVRNYVVQYIHRYMVQSVAEHMFGNLLGHKRQAQILDLVQQQREQITQNLGVESYHQLDIYPEHELHIATNLLTYSIERKLREDKTPCTRENVEYLCAREEGRAQEILQDVSKQLYSCLSILRSHYYKDLLPNVTRWMDMYHQRVQELLGQQSVFTDDLDTLFSRPMEMWEPKSLASLGTDTMLTEKVRDITRLPLTEYSWSNSQYVMSKIQLQLHKVQLDLPTQKMVSQQLSSITDQYDGILSAFLDPFTGQTLCNRLVYTIKNMTRFSQVKAVDEDIHRLTQCALACKDIRGLPDRLYSNIQSWLDVLYMLGYSLMTYIEKRYSSSILLDDATVYKPVYSHYDEKYPISLLRKYVMVRYKLKDRSLPSYGVSIEELSGVDRISIEREVVHLQQELTKKYQDSRREAECLAFREILQELASKHNVPTSVLTYYYNEFTRQHQVIDTVLTKFFIREVWKDTVMYKYYTAQSKHFTEQIQMIGIEQLNYIDDKMRNQIRKEVEFLTFTDWIGDYFSQILRRVN